MTIPVRPMAPADVAAARQILNQIIRAGGTTAIEAEVDDTEFARWYLLGDDLVCSHVALDHAGHVAGFQWVGRHENLPDDCGDIATFARQRPVLPGVGSALFAQTCRAVRGAGLARINATIRADNRPGLAYYTKMGFVDCSRAPAVPLRDGTPVDRISKRFSLA